MPVQKLTKPDFPQICIRVNIKIKKGAVAAGASSDLMNQLRHNQEEYAEQVKIIESQSSQEGEKRTTEEVYQLVDELKQKATDGTVLEEVQQLKMKEIKRQDDEKAIVVRLEGGWLSKKFNSITKGIGRAVGKIGSLFRKKSDS